jgi:phage repressor protein C with HTH and peptisase S24 domain
MLDSESLAAKARAALDRSGLRLKDVAAACGVTVAAVSEWKRTGRIAKKHLPVLAALTNTPVDWWLTSAASGASDEFAHAQDQAANDRPRKRSIELPSEKSGLLVPTQQGGKTASYVLVQRLLNPLGAGSAELQEFDEVDGSHSFRRDWLMKKGWPVEALRVLSVQGNSMAPYINDGDVVLVNTADRRLVNGEVYAIAADGEAMVKRLFKQLDGKIRVESDNKEYPPDYFTPDRDGVILGAVVWRAG